MDVVDVVDGIDVLIACHCVDIHRAVYLVDSMNDKKYNIKTKTGLAGAKKKYKINRLDYIDTNIEKCKESDIQFTNWDNLPKYDVICAIHCPIYGIFNSEKTIEELPIKLVNRQINFYNTISQHLKPNGHLQYNFNRSGWQKARANKNIKYWFDAFKLPLKLDLITQSKMHTIPFYADIDSDEVKKDTNFRFVILRNSDIQRSKTLKKRNKSHKKQQTRKHN